ncbi:MAG TPA: solute carrier family 23 protein [Candidatus Cloacimonadota bacterium]|nr:solute carrier family 23 protein [Candidatus Cloacimonadota bacterium]
MPSQMLYGVNDKPPFFLNLFLGLQHAILIIPGSVLTPLIIANLIGTSAGQKHMLVFATMLISGISSFIQIKKVGRIGSGYLLFLGTSSAYMGACISAGFMGGFGLIAAMGILSAPMEVILSYFLWYIRKIVTPNLGGIVIILIAICVIPVMMDLWIGTSGTENYCSVANLVTGMITIIFTLAFAIFGSKYLRLWSPIIGIAAGMIASTFLGIADFSSLHNYPLFGLPHEQWIFPDFHLSIKHLPLFIAFLFATFASTVESVGDAIIAQTTSDPDFRKVDYEAVQGCLYADGVGNALSGLCGTMPNTTYSGNIAVVGLTKVASRSVGYAASVFMIILAFMPKLVYGLTLIPGPVLAASSLVFMGLLFASGIKLIAENGIDYDSGIIVGVSLTVGIISTFKLFFPGLIGDAFKPFVENGIATGGITALILTMITNLRPAKRRSLRLQNDLEELPKLRSFLDDLSAKYKLDAERTFHLQLACEEVFAYLQNTDSCTPITFNLQLADENLLVEVTDRSVISDIDNIDPKEIIQSKPEDLGLLLLNKLTRNIKHLHIGNHNSITFEI